MTNACFFQCTLNKFFGVLTYFSFASLCMTFCNSFHIFLLYIPISTLSSHHQAKHTFCDRIKFKSPYASLLIHHRSRHPVCQTAVIHQQEALAILGVLFLKIAPIHSFYRLTALNDPVHVAIPSICYFILFIQSALVYQT